ncbi:phosphotransferase [Photobacterium sp. CCB-ST2H9]|uniref:phosphotransferase n=1 Tax=Photobacterium sp. CCB-ST2H9 TaxID=2912855 RepID=UPI002004FAA3|nr:phosphotransferase [Photobacterium sp. CCB-ST2H9]UTM56206.1 phosphotransferase [Photobacterium sp. CCB-ST2H9]
MPSLSAKGALPFSRIAGFDVIQARPLGGGLSNRCWQLTLKPVSSLSDGISTTSAVWRPVSPASLAFGVNRDHEYQILTAIQHIGLSPAPVARTGEGILVAWLEGETFEQPPSLNELITVQTQVHRLPVPEWRLEVRQRAEHYLKSVHPDDRHDGLERVCAKFFRQIPRSRFADTCCHHDLGYYNLIRQSDGRIRVIDWEYAAAGDPMLDLSLTIQANSLNVQQAVNTYAREMGYDAEVVSEAVLQWLPWCDFLAMLWYYAGANLWQDPSYRLEAEALFAKLTH